MADAGVQGAPAAGPGRAAAALRHGPPRGRPGMVATAVLAATVGAYLLLGRAWANAIGYDFAGPPRPVLGVLALALAIWFLRLDAVRRREHAARAARTVVLYTRKDCTLCEEAAAVLRAVAAETGHDVWEQDVDEDPRLVARYGDRVPVAVKGGEELFELRADVVLLRERLREG